MKNSILITIVVALVVGALGFFGGMQYQKNKVPQFAFRQEGRMGGGRNGAFSGGVNGAKMGGRGVLGEIIESDGKSMTVKLTDGSSKIVILNSKTAINKASEGKAEDLKKGEKVMVFGSENSDGSISAQNIQLNPIARAGSKPN